MLRRDVCNLIFVSGEQSRVRDRFRVEQAKEAVEVPERHTRSRMTCNFSWHQPTKESAERRRERKIAPRVDMLTSFFTDKVAARFFFGWTPNAGSRKWEAPEKRSHDSRNQSRCLISMQKIVTSMLRPHQSIKSLCTHSRVFTISEAAINRYHSSMHKIDF